MAYYGKRTPNRPSVKQVSLMHTLAHKLGWSDNRYHDELQHRYHAASCKNLTRQQTRDFIEYLKAEFEKAFGPAPQPAQPADETAKAKSKAAGKAGADRLTPQQRTYIVNMWWKVCRGQTPLEKREGLRSFVKRQTGCDDLSFVTRAQGSALICSLQVMCGDRAPKKRTRKEPVNG